MKINTEQLEQVSKFKYMGYVKSQDGKLDEEIKEQGEAVIFLNSIKRTILANGKY